MKKDMKKFIKKAALPTSMLWLYSGISRCKTAPGVLITIAIALFIGYSGIAVDDLPDDVDDNTKTTEF